MQSKLSIAQALNDLIKSGKTDEPTTLSAPGFNMVDIYPIFEHSFNEKAKATFAKKADSLIFQYNEKYPQGAILHLLGKLELKTCKQFKDEVNVYIRKFDKVCFMASRATKDKLPEAIEKVIAAVNDVADKDFTKAYMVQLGVLELMPVDLPEPEYVVISYITLTDKGEAYAKLHHADVLINEGGIPLRI